MPLWRPLLYAPLRQQCNSYLMSSVGPTGGKRLSVSNTPPILDIWPYRPVPAETKPLFNCRFFLNAYAEPMPFGRYAEVETNSTFLNIEKQNGQDIPVNPSGHSCPSVMIRIRPGTRPFGRLANLCHYSISSCAARACIGDLGSPQSKLGTRGPRE